MLFWECHLYSKSTKSYSRLKELFLTVVFKCQYFSTYFFTNPSKSGNKWKTNQEALVINTCTSFRPASSVTGYVLDPGLLWPKFSSSTARHFWADSVSRHQVDKSQITEVRKWGCFQLGFMPFPCVSSHLSTEKTYGRLHHDTLWVSLATSAPPDKTRTLHRLTAHASRKETMTRINLKHTKSPLKNSWPILQNRHHFQCEAFSYRSYR